MADDGGKIDVVDDLLVNVEGGVAGFSTFLGAGGE